MSTPRHIRIPGYRVVREVGRGGIASVYLAQQESLDRNVALKVMSPALVDQESFVDRFRREGRIIARLNHPGVVTIYDIDVADFQPYIAMEYLSGGSLKDRVGRGVPPAVVLVWTRQVAEALSYAHRKGVVHRDVKPENILFRDANTVVLTDFGIAKTALGDPDLSLDGVVVGTPRYLSPEQARGSKTDHRTDIYALGVVLYELLTGHAPYAGEDSRSLLSAHVNEPVPRLATGLSQLQGLVDGMMAKDPHHRMRNCAEVIKMIGAVHSPTTVCVAPPPRSQPRAAARRTRWWAAGAGLMCTMLVLSVWHAPVDPPYGAPHVADTETHRDPHHPESAPASTPRSAAVSSTARVATAADTAAGPDTSVPRPRGATEVAPHAVEATVQPLLQRGRRQLALGQLREPAGDNAVATFRSVLRRRPGHAEAVAGLRRVADVYLRRAQSSVEIGDYALAKSQIEVGLEVAANESLVRLSKRVNRIFQGRREFALGVAYRDGVNDIKDIGRAVKHFGRAAALGHARAQYELGLAYANGVGAIRDEEQALRWLRHAAEQGEPEAQYNFGLGLLFGPHPDPARAARLMKRLGEERYRPAYRVLGWMYGTGTGTEHSIKKSLKWYFKRAMKNMFGAPALPENVVPIWQQQFEDALSESTEALDADASQSG